MKKLIFVINNLEIGGVQKSLLNLLCEIHEQYDITLLTFYSNEEFEKLLPDNIKVIKTNSAFRQLGMSLKHVQHKPVLFVERLACVALTRLLGRSFVINLMCLGKKKYEGYDVAISYIHESSQNSLYGGCNEFVLKKVGAKKKVGWLHCDFGRCGANNRRSRMIYSKLDQIVACSEGCREAFLNCFAEFANKTVCVRNCNEYEKIKTLADDAVEYDHDYFNIVTVARLAREKGIERGIEAVNEAVRRGYKVKYHIVGAGDQEMVLKNLVLQMQLNDTVKFYGQQVNPYPYIKGADLFLLPSYQEAAPMVFDEAACLGVPVLATKTLSAEEMIQKSNTGFVCGNDQYQITKTLLELLSEPQKVANVAMELSAFTFNNEHVLEQLEDVLLA